MMMKKYGQLSEAYEPVEISAPRSNVFTGYLQNVPPMGHDLRDGRAGGGQEARQGRLEHFGVCDSGPRARPELRVHVGICGGGLGARQELHGGDCGGGLEARHGHGEGDEREASQRLTASRS